MAINIKGIQVGSKVDFLFFNDKKVIARMNSAARKVLSKIGSHGRQYIRRSMKYSASEEDKKRRLQKRLDDGKIKPEAYKRRLENISEKASPEGTPPYYHTRGFNIRNRIFFGVDRHDLNVVIGFLRRDSQTARIHEEGGKKKVYVRQPNWKLKVGGHGPVQVISGGLKITKLKTDKQVSRAKRIARQYKVKPGASTKKTASYPKRPFLDPALKRNRNEWLKMFRGSI